MEIGGGGGGSAVLRLALVLAVAFLLVFPTRSLRFDLQSGKPKCISEDIKLNAIAVGKYSLIKSNETGTLPDSYRVTARISSPRGDNIHSADNVETGSFAFTAKDAGDFLVCFWTPAHDPPTTVALDFDMRVGVAAKDWTSIAKKEHLDLMEVELLKMKDTVQSIHDDMFYLRSREAEMQRLSEIINAGMAWLSLFSLAVCLSVAGLQLWHLKTFFERKKLL